jgi:phosphocarrier protein
VSEFRSGQDFAEGKSIHRATLTIANRLGLHARAAAKFVKTAGQFEADVTVCKDGTEVSGLSIMGLMMLAATPGSEIVVESTGDQAEDALGALKDLVVRNFDED